MNCEGASPNSPWPLSGRVTRFRFSTRVNATDQLVLTLRNGDLALFGHRALQHGTVLDVRWGYAGQLGAPRRMHLEEFRGFTDLELVLSGRERPLGREAKVRAWADFKVADVVREVAGAHGFSGSFLHLEVPSPHALETFNQAAETDAAFLHRLAASHGFAFYIDAEGLHWHRAQKSQAPVMVLNYGHMGCQITEISFTSNLMRHIGRVEVRGRDQLERRDVRGIANSDTVSRTTLAETVEVIDPEKYASAMQAANAKASVHPSGAANEDQAQAEAQTRFLGAEATALEARAQVIGSPSLLANRIVRLEGASPYLSGNYFIQEAEHTVGPGYSTSLLLARDGGGPRLGASAASQGGTPNQQPSPAPEAVQIIDPQRYAEATEP